MLKRLASAEVDSIHLTSVAVTCCGQLLMGLRKDNGKWTLPGGHMDPGEMAYEGAMRELREEAGISAKCLYNLGCLTIISPRGRKVTVHAYRLDTYRRPTSTAFDPDNEISRWEWVPMNQDVEQLKVENLHSPKNVTLKLLGLQNW